MYLLDKFENKYVLKGILKAETPIHIGGGSMEFSPNAVDSPVIRDENNNPFIPGSSLKGVLRSFLEGIINSGVFEEYKCCNIISNPCNANEIKKKYRGLNKSDKEVAEAIYASECDVCRIFGGQGFASKIHVDDGRLIGEKAYIQFRDGIVIDRDTLTAAGGKKYNFECVAAGTEFRFEMVIDNLEEEYEMLLKIIIRFLESGDMIVGGKTSVGLGNVILKNKEIYKVDRNNMKEYYIDGINENNKFKFEVML